MAKEVSLMSSARMEKDEKKLFEWLRHNGKWNGLVLVMQ